MSGVALGTVVIGSAISIGGGMLANANREGGETQYHFRDRDPQTEAIMGKWGAQQEKGWDALNRGEEAPWFKKLRPIMEKRKKQSLRDTYFGDDFGPGVWDLTKGYDVDRGAGMGRGSQAGKNMGRQINQYALGEQSISDFMETAAAQSQEKLRYALPGEAQAYSQDRMNWASPFGQTTTPLKQNVWDDVSKMGGMIGSMGPMMSSAAGGGGQQYGKQTPPPGEWSQYDIGSGGGPADFSGVAGSSSGSGAWQGGSGSNFQAPYGYGDVARTATSPYLNAIPTGQSGFNAGTSMGSNVNMGDIWNTMSGGAKKVTDWGNKLQSDTLSNLYNWRG